MEGISTRQKSLMTQIHWRICATCGLPKAISEFRSSPSCPKCQSHATRTNRKRANPNNTQGSVLPQVEAGEALEDTDAHAGDRPA